MSGRLPFLSAVVAALVAVPAAGLTFLDQGLPALSSGPGDFRQDSLFAAVEAPSVVVPAVTPELNDANDGERYFMFGDSITAAAGGDNVPFASNPLWQTRSPGPDSSSIDFNQDGSARGTCWAEENLDRVLPPVALAAQQTFLLEFHHNDRPTSKNRCGWAINETVAGNERLYDRLMQHGVGEVRFTAMLGKPNRCLGAGGWDAQLADQTARFLPLRDLALRHGTTVIPMADAIDVVPRNGQIDPVDPALVYDCIHPNREGNRVLGEFLWFFLRGEDHRVTIHGETGLFVVAANYTQRVPVPLQAGWDPANVTAFDLTAGTEVPALAGEPGLALVDTVDGHEYLVGLDAARVGPSYVE